MAGTSGMKDPVQKRDHKQAPHRTAVGLRGPDRGRDLAIKLRLLRQQPADDAAQLRLAAAWPGSPELVLSHERAQRAIEREQNEQRSGADRHAARKAWTALPAHGH